jgi:bacteriocin-like protein
MSERIRELTESELDAVSGGCTSNEHGTIGETSLVTWLVDFMVVAAVSQAAGRRF